MTRTNSHNLIADLLPLSIEEARALVLKYQAAEGNAARLGNDSARNRYRSRWRALSATFFGGRADVRAWGA